MRQESHRIHWQQWASQDPQSKRDLMTRSAAVRLTDAATTKDVVQLLKGEGSLVLVGTLYNVATVRFAHESITAYNKAAANVNQTTTTGGSGPSLPPFHLIRTLRIEENPLQVRDDMQNKLDKKYETLKQQLGTSGSSSSIAPKLQWFFVPTIKKDHSSSNVPDKTNNNTSKTAKPTPNWIELDGYSTSMEEENFVDEEDQDDEDQDECSGDQGDNKDQLYLDPVGMPWRKAQEEEEDLRPQSNNNSMKNERYYMKQMQRHQQLSMYRKDHPRTISGYLYKKSELDPHVWRKMYCVLSEEYFWFVTRIRGGSNSGGGIAHHGRISLDRAFIADYEHKGFSWEVVTASGKTHTFRTKALEAREAWVMCLQERIQQCHENQLMKQAELIVSEETSARNKRMMQYFSVTTNSHCSFKKMMIHSDWALRVLTYRELCRHIQFRLPTKPLFLVTKKPSNESLSADSTSTPETMDIDKNVQTMISDSWDLAADLLNEITNSFSKEGGRIDTATSNAASSNTTARRNLETFCRHIEYILTGKMPPLSTDDWSNTIVPPSAEKLHDPPPVDLFDKLFLELGKTIKN